MVDLNADMGEAFGAWRIGVDADLMPLITSANVACGFHAGDPLVMVTTVRALVGHGVAVGAHPGYADLRGFGRRVIPTSPDELRADIIYQIGALGAICEAEETPLHHVKPHGAVYNLAVKDADVAATLAGAIVAIAPHTVLYAPAGSELARAGKRAGLTVAMEAFADRAYMADGTLAPRARPDAILHEPEAIAGRVRDLVEGRPIATLDGDPIRIEAETICVHADSPEAVRIATALRGALDDAGIEVGAL